MTYAARGWPLHHKPVLRLLAGLTICLAAALPAGASGGPENVLLVVNSRSPDSLCIANHYAKLRHIPPSNFLFLDWDPKQEYADVDTFREKILIPVLKAAKNSAASRPADRLCGLFLRFPLGHSHRRGHQEVKAVLEKPELGKEEKSSSIRRSGRISRRWLRSMA